MNKFYGYIRVSTVKQGERGVSLQEQRAAIEHYATRHNLQIVEWFEERLTAAKQGRPLFMRMLRLLRDGKAAGLVIHKIDRGARNLKDWAELGTLIDSGVAVHFANESVDLRSRGGRLSADIQAVVAADYVRNLREETQKGITGRLRQGLYPFAAPLGYIDTGPGRVKTVDPLKGPLMQQAFRLYAGGSYTLDTLTLELTKRGLRTKHDRPLRRGHLSSAFSNPFYMGLMRVRTTGQTYEGKHDTLVPASLFRAVQDTLAGRTRSTAWKEEFMFRGLFRCSLCDRLLTGEHQKGHVYYRCHTKTCQTKCFREEVLEASILSSWPAIAETEDETATITALIHALLADHRRHAGDHRVQIEMQIGAVKSRLERLIDTLVDGHLDPSSFEIRKASLLQEQAGLQEALDGYKTSEAELFSQELFELAFSAQRSYKTADTAAKREMVVRLTSNRLVAGKDVVVEPHPVLQHIANRRLKQ